MALTRRQLKKIRKKEILKLPDKAAELRKILIDPQMDFKKQGFSVKDTRY